MNIMRRFVTSFNQFSRNTELLSRFAYPLSTGYPTSSGPNPRQLSFLQATSAQNACRNKSVLTFPQLVPHIFTKLQPGISNIQCRTYKARNVLKLRCDGCYFEKRDERWFVECSLKPRHKQMQLLGKRFLYKDDCSKGDVKTAMYWRFNKRDRFYWFGDNKYARHDWTGERIAKIV